MSTSNSGTWYSANMIGVKQPCHTGWFFICQARDVPQEYWSTHNSAFFVIHQDGQIYDECKPSGRAISGRYLREYLESEPLAIVAINYDYWKYTRFANIPNSIDEETGLEICP